MSCKIKLFSRFFPSPYFCKMDNQVTFDIIKKQIDVLQYSIIETNKKFNKAVDQLKHEKQDYEKSMKLAKMQHRIYKSKVDTLENLTRQVMVFKLITKSTF